MSKIQTKTILETGRAQSGQVAVAVIGAGPYGLSLAAHLQAKGVPFRIFGRPMETWRTRMPAGMALKSEGFASRLYDPAGTFTLARYCAQNGLPYADVGLPVPLATFAAYGEAFQREMVPGLEPQNVVAVTRSAGGFRLQLEDGTTLEAARVVVAAGIGSFAYLPPELRGFPAPLVSHSADHASLDKFAGHDVTVIGAGASALDTAGLLAAAGARVRLVARVSAIRFHAPPEETRTLRQRLRAPRSGLGAGWKSLLVTKLPMLFRRLPARLRQTIVNRHLGPVGCWFVRDQVEGKVEMVLGTTLGQAALQGGLMRLRLDGPAGPTEIATEHVIAATGFRVDLARLTFLDPALRAQIRCLDHSPELSAAFESSVPGLHFVGVTAAQAFGPLLRFAYGAEFAAKRLARFLAGRQRLGANAGP